MSGVVNKTKERNKGHMNFDGGQSFMVKSPLLALYTCAASSFFGEPAYYITDEMGKKHMECSFESDSYTLCDEYGETTTSVMRRLIKEALDYDAKSTLELAVHLRHAANMRTTPAIILAEASLHPKVKGTGLVREFGQNILYRLDEVTTVIAYLNVWNARKIPNSIKRTIRDRLEVATGYEIAKYRMKNRDVSLVDVVNIVHPRPLNGKGEVFAQLMNGTLRQSDVGETWESIISGGGSWHDAVGAMGHMALLRNLRNLLCNKVPAWEFVHQLENGVISGRQFPFRYFTAMLELEMRSGDIDPVDLDMTMNALENCMVTALEAMPTIPGRTIVFVDNSGSARNTYVSAKSKMTVAKAANLLATIIVEKSENGGRVCPFGDRHTMLGFGGQNILEGAKVVDRYGADVGLATEAGLYTGLLECIENGMEFDNIVILSDMQCGHGNIGDGLYGYTSVIPSKYTRFRSGNQSYIDLGKMMEDYRKLVNPEAYLFSVQCAGYPDNIIPFNTKRDFIFGGWNEAVVQYMAAVRPPLDKKG